MTEKEGRPAASHWHVTQGQLHWQSGTGVSVCHVKHLSGPATEDEAVQAIHDRFRELNPHEAAHAMRVTVDGRTRWFVANGTIVAMSTCVQTPCPKGPGVDTDSDTG